MDGSQHLPESGASPNLIKALFSKLSFRQHPGSVVANSSDARPPEASTTAQPEPQPTPILDIAEHDERSSGRSLKGSEEKQSYTDAPDVSKAEDSENASSRDNKGENTDSGYASLASTPTQDRDQAFKLKAFSTIEVPKELHRRFFDLKVLYSQQLLQTVSKGKKNRGDISMKLKFMGVDERGAKPYIVVHCDKRVAKRVKKFFNQTHVLEDLRSDFQVHVVEGHLVSLAGLGSVYVWGRNPDYTLCGTAVVLTRDGKDPAVATLSGIVMVSKAGTLSKLYGITAGHAIASAYGPEDYGAAGESPEQDYGSDSDNDGEECDATDNIDYMPALAAAGWHAGGKVRPPRIGSVDGNQFPPKCVDYDWGLITLQETTKGNYLQYMSPGSFLLSQPLFAKKTITLKKRRTYPVVIMTSRGLQAGTLATNGSSMVSAIGDNFVSVFDFIPNPTSELMPGDSGSWVVSKDTGEAYGHVVSVDSFGEAYIMPIQGTLDEIQAHLHADSVILPSEVDIMKQEETRNFILDSGYSTMQNSPLDI